MTPSAATESPVEPPARRRWWLPWTAGGVALLLVVGGAAWWLSWSSPVRNTFGSFGVSYDRSVPGSPLSLGIAHLCLDGADGATVDQVTADPTGLTVVDFAVRPVPPEREPALGSAELPLRELGFGDQRSLGASCADGRAAELGVQVTRGPFAPSYTDGFDVHWTAGVRSGVLRVPVQVTLCTPQEGPELCGQWLEELD